jgi:rhamnosyltransferase
MRIAAVVIVYNPGDTVISNILSYSSSIEKLFVIDNSVDSSLAFVQQIQAISNCEYLSDGKNEGIAKRLNEACAFAIKNNMDWILTMDQDSKFEANNFSQYLSCLNNFPNKAQVALFGINHEGKGETKDDCSYLETNKLITSGTFVNLKLFPLIGNFNEDLFIDQVDFDYCYRSVLKGYRIIKFCHINLKHALGLSSEHVSLKTFTKTFRSLHSPIRLYYMTRNYLYIRSRYGTKFPAEVALDKIDLINRIKNNLLYNKNKIALLKYIFKGILDYRQRRMGKYK